MSFLLSIPRLSLWAGYGQALFLSSYLAYLSGRGMSKPYLLSIPRLSLRAGYGHAFSSLHTPPIPSGGVWTTLFLSSYPAYPSGRGMSKPFLLSIPRLALRAGYEHAFSSPHTPPIPPGGVWTSLFFSPYPAYPSERGMDNSFFILIPRLSLRAGYEQALSSLHTPPRPPGGV